MRGYARTIFSREDLALRARAARIVRALPDQADPRSLRCHEVTRAVGSLLGLEVQDGSYGCAEHSWLWIAKPIAHSRHNMGAVRLLDCYAIGRLPQVQLVDCWYLLPEGRSYKWNEPERTDIRHDVVRRLMRAGRRALQPKERR